MEPRARRDDLEIQRMGDELVIYDLRSNEAHALDALATDVFDLADGSRTVAEIAHLLQERRSATTTDDVEATLASLRDADLVLGGLTRRDALRRAAAVGAVSLVGAGMLKSVLAPAPAAAQSAPGPIGPAI